MHLEAHLEGVGGVLEGGVRVDWRILRGGWREVEALGIYSESLRRSCEIRFGERSPTVCFLSGRWSVMETNEGADETILDDIPMLSADAPCSYA